MLSIRRQLLLWLLLGLTVLLASLGVAVYFAARNHFLAEVDEELLLAARSVRIRAEMDSRPGGPPTRRITRRRAEARWAEFDYEDGELFFQVWDSEGEVRVRSASLGECRWNDYPSNPV